MTYCILFLSTHLNLENVVTHWKSDSEQINYHILNQLFRKL